MKLPTLFARTNTGAIQTWEVEIDGDKYRTTSGQIDGAKTTKAWTTAKPKNVGRSNESTSAEQALTEAKAKWQKKIDSGYFEDVKQIDNFTFVEPMLAKQWDEYREDVTWPIYVDNKFNGVRCERWAQGAYSRRGKRFHNIRHIIHVTEALFRKYPKLTLDGELFNETLKNNLNRLIELVSVNIKEKDVTPELESESEKIVRFYVYDAYDFADVTKDTPFLVRRQRLQELIRGIPYLVPVRHTVVNNENHLKAMLKEKAAQKEEGLIIRWGDCKYENKRSKHLLKMKVFITDEFKCLEIHEGDANWLGKAKMASFEIKLPNGKKDTFKASFEGSYADNEKIWRERDKYVGRKATIEFQEYSEYGIPLIGYIRAWRTYE